MYNKAEFEKWISDSGLKKSKIAEAMGIKQPYLSSKIAGRVRFTATEGADLLQLGMSREQYMRIFGS